MTMFKSNPILAYSIVASVPVIMYFLTMGVKLFRKKPYMYISVLGVPTLIALHFLVGIPGDEMFSAKKLEGSSIFLNAFILMSVPLIIFFSFRKVLLFKRKPIFFSLFMLFSVVVVSYFVSK